MLKQLEKLSITGLYILLGLGLSLAVLVSAQTYTMSEDLSSHGAAMRVADQYLRMKIRQGDTAGSVRICGDRIEILEQYPEGAFLDLIYLHGNALLEQLTVKDLEFDETMGDPVLPCQSIRFENLGRGFSYEAVIDADAARSGYILIRACDAEEVDP